MPDVVCQSQESQLYEQRHPYLIEQPSLGTLPTCAIQVQNTAK